MVHLEVHPNRGKYVAYRRIRPVRIGPKLKPRTYYVHQEIRDVHSVGEVRLVFSTTKAPLKDQGVDVQKILMTDDLTLSLQDVIELYQLRWQIDSFSRTQIDAGPVPVPVPAVRDGGDVGAAGPGEFHLSGVGASPPVEETVAQGEGRRWWQAQRTYGLAGAVPQSAEQKELKLLADALETPSGQKRLSKLLGQSHPKEYRAVI